MQNVQLISDHKYDYADVLPMVFFRGFSRNLFDFLASGGRVVATGFWLRFLGRMGGLCRWGYLLCDIMDTNCMPHINA